MAEAIWKSKSGDVPVSQLNTFRLKNAITKVEGEIASGSSTPEKTAILSALKEEIAKPERQKELSEATGSGSSTGTTGSTPTGA